MLNIGRDVLHHIITIKNDDMYYKYTLKNAGICQPNVESKMDYPTVGL